MSAEPSPGSLEDILGVWDEQGPFPLRAWLAAHPVEADR